MKQLLITIALLLVCCGSAFASEPVPMSDGSVELSDIICDGEWVLGPFWITVCGWWECPDFYPPHTNIRVEHCTTNGLIRIPKKYWKEKNKYIDSKDLN